MSQLLAFFLKLGVAHITVYAFAIDNFQRPADEVEGLMTLAKDKLSELGQKGCVALPSHDERLRDASSRATCCIEVRLLS